MVWLSLISSLISESFLLSLTLAVTLLCLLYSFGIWAFYLGVFLLSPVLSVKLLLLLSLTVSKTLFSAVWETCLKFLVSLTASNPKSLLWRLCCFISIIVDACYRSSCLIISCANVSLLFWFSLTFSLVQLICFAKGILCILSSYDKNVFNFFTFKL